MSKQSLLLVDGDTRSLRVLEVSLRKAGFTVTTAETVHDAIETLALHAPDLIVSETVFGDGDGFELRRRVRAMPERGEIPFIFLTAEQAIENKIRGLELGVDDYLTKPIYIKEIITRVNILLQKRQRTRFEERRDGRTRFAGRVTDMPVVDVIQTIEISRKSGVIQFVGERNNQATIYFRDGKVIDAEAGTLQGEDAVYRLLTWNDGEFEVVFRTIRRRDVITTSSQGMLMEGMRRLDEWSRLLEQLPPITHRFEVDASELVSRLGEVPDDNNRILRLIDGKRTLIEVIDSSDVGDLECLQAISRLYFEELLLDVDQTPTVRRDSKPQPLVATPFEEVASSPGIPLPPFDIERGREEPSATAERLDSTPPSGGMTVQHPTQSSGGNAVAPIDRAAGGRTQAPTTDEIEDVTEHAIEEIGPLMGGFRPSSLRLIDEAVAAAQAIDSTLFEDEPRVKQPEASVVVRAADGAELVAGEPDEPPVRRRDSGLLMIGSHGRDRAEASGELSLAKGTTAPISETQRELVTILPRRITREIPIVTAPEPEPEPELEPPPAAAPPVEIVRPQAIPLRMPSGTTLTRPSRGPGTGAIVLLVLAAILTLLAVYLRLSRSHDHGKAVDAAPPPIVIGGLSPDGALEASKPSAGPDAAPVVPPDDAPVRRDARVADAAAVAVDAGLSAAQHAKSLSDAAAAAVADSQFQKALELVDASLKLRHTEAAYLLRATTLQRLDRIDDAVDSVDKALEIARARGSELASAWHQRGMILWTARRRDEARPSLKHYLELSPNAKDADDVRTLLDSP